MIEKKRRIPRSQFPNNPKQRVIWSGKIIRITHLKHTTPTNIFSVVASKKSLTTAISRNLFKRRVYHAISGHIIEFDAQYKTKFIISILHEIKKIPTFIEINTDINDFLKTTHEKNHHSFN